MAQSSSKGQAKPGKSAKPQAPVAKTPVKTPEKAKKGGK
jgi:hypothetical protein